jgi:protein kinase-like protein
MADFGAQNLYSVAHPEYYETLSRYRLSPAYVDQLTSLLPGSWSVARHDVWVQAAKGGGNSAVPPPNQGFKIHVSSTPEHALRVLDLAVPACIAREVEFKIAGDPGLLDLLNSKLQARGQSGKFMTIYPPDEETFVSLLKELYERTRHEDVAGPYILSDRRYRDSRVLFYRYGGFRPPHRLNADGTRSWFLVSPEGEHVPDQRLPYFLLPPWVSDPFPGPSSPAGPGETVLNDRYRVEGALSFSNAGGVYAAHDTATGRSVVVKEARPLTNCWMVGDRSWDAVHLLEREHAVLRRLEGLDFVPAPIDLFTEWEHTFLVEERVPGHSLDTFWAREDVLLAPYVRRPGRIERFVPRFRHVAERLVSTVLQVHGRGVLIGDLSPRNIMIDPETLRLSLIDFESAVIDDDATERAVFSTRWGTPGFVHPERASRGKLLPEDDFYALGMILYGSVVPVNYLFALDRTAESVFLERFVALGVPAQVKEVVDALLGGDPAGALAVLARWTAE